ncbi:hypothetical protein [Kibdelosporangium phytohabitans]|uniref:hypothetical protein n=1 Tax=Kibdelosporangium phytohabitans TaxID=860235 RepID=UPI0012F9264C|nr:hypothetical protein [Kibdelosporangium phytohabitans]MBE1462879.1 hypothetical protein [Kibdelosporangium phytohabitans]
MARRFVHQTGARRRRRGGGDLESPGACTCRAFSGGRAVHNYGQPGCRYAELDSHAVTH